MYCTCILSEHHGHVKLCTDGVDFWPDFEQQQQSANGFLLGIAQFEKDILQHVLVQFFLKHLEGVAESGQGFLMSCSIPVSFLSFFCLHSSQDFSLVAY